jgi:peroxiredoxin
MRARPVLRTVALALVACLLTTALASGQTPGAAAPPPPSVKTGDTAPDFTASYLTTADANGGAIAKSVKLSEFKGQKNVVLAFFPAAFSPGCTSEMAKYPGEHRRVQLEQHGAPRDERRQRLGQRRVRREAGRAVPHPERRQARHQPCVRRLRRAVGVARRTTFVIDRQGVVQKVFMAQEALDPAHALATCALLKEVK